MGCPGGEKSAPWRLPARCRLVGLARLPGIGGGERVPAEWRARPGGGGWGATGPQRLLPAAASARSAPARS